MGADFLLHLDAISYTLIAVLVGLVAIPLVLSKEPDIHPLALLRQSAVSPIRNPKESAVHRSLHTPFGYPLVSGLGLPAEQKYSTRNGDIRDIWKLQVAKGNGKILSVKGADKIVEHETSKLTKDIHALGQHLQNIGAKRVAIYLPNDIENLVASFACAFYNLTLVILPFDPAGVEGVVDLIARSSTDVLIAPAGMITPKDLEPVNLKEVILVVEVASQHLGWDTPEGSKNHSVTYHEIIKEEVQPVDDLKLDLDAPAVVVCGPKIVDSIDIVEFSHRNIIAGVAAQNVYLPKKEQYTPEDVFISVDTLSDLYARVHTYVALAAGSTVALNSIAGRKADIEKVVRNVNPSIIVVSPESIFHTYRATQGYMMEIWHGMIHFFQTRTLVQSGQIPKGNFWTRLNDYVRPEVGDKLRLVFVAEAGGNPASQPINSLDLADMKIFFKSKVVYGLKHHKVAGPVTQYNVYDYRVQMPEQLPSRNKKIPRYCAHFGAVTPGLEIKLKDIEKYTADDKEGPRGLVFVAGPTVAGGKETSLGFVGKWLPEGVLSYATGP